ncbi:hypothetical protein [Pseudomonas aeruginosa]|uniref:hypothetical protein n=1 Tax=Pseudomonas aeruginosa TaxID=287 RepID=UPI000EB5E401|nr:hypothetical protein [Pseudomonas aeruginosa]
MCDESPTYTERVTAWLKEDEPTAEQIQEAYSKMLTLLAKNPSKQGPDADTCLETLANAYARTGGDMDELLSMDGKLKLEQANADDEQCALDASPLYEVSDCRAVGLPEPQKKELFKQLKQQYGSNLLGA